MMAGVQALARAKAALQGDLIFAATAGEEVDSLGATAVAAIPGLGPLQAIVISEPSSNEIFVAEKGAFWLEVTTHGRTAHGSMPEQGRNAIIMMMKLLEEFEKESIPHREHPLVGGFTRSVNTIAGGVKTNVVPDSCVATIDMRTVPGQDHRAIRKQVEKIIADLGRSIPDFKATLKVTNDRAPLETSTSEPAVQKWMEVLSRIRGVNPVPKGVAYFSDAVVFVPALGAPMILCGPGEARLAHQPNEYVEISSLVGLRENLRPRCGPAAAVIPPRCAAFNKGRTFFPDEGIIFPPGPAPKSKSKTICSIFSFLGWRSDCSIFRHRTPVISRKSPELMILKSISRGKFLLFPALFLWMLWVLHPLPAGAAEGALTPRSVLTFVGGIASAALIHEVAHAGAAALTGTRLSTVVHKFTNVFRLRSGLLLYYGKRRTFLDHPEIFRRAPLFRNKGKRARNAVPSRANPEEKENLSAQ